MGANKNMSENDNDQADEPTKSVETTENDADQADDLTESVETTENDADQTESVETTENDTDQADDLTESVETSDGAPGENGVIDQNKNLETDGESVGDPQKDLGLEEKASENSSDELDLNSEASADSKVEPDEGTSMPSDEASGEATNIEAQNNSPKENVPSVDIAVAGQGVATVELELINGNLKSIEKEISSLANPVDQQLDKAKRLILMLSGVTGIVLVASITFFIVMSISIAQKVDDLDRVLMAVAKRGMQLADGIETISEMEGKLNEVIEDNEQIIPGLSNIKTQITVVEQKLTDSEEQTRSAIKAQGGSILKSQDQIKNNVNAEVNGLAELIKNSVKLKPLEREHLGLKSQLEKMNSSMINVETKVQDLYVIKQAEIETAYKGLSRSE